FGRERFVCECRSGAGGCGGPQRRRQSFALRNQTWKRAQLAANLYACPTSFELVAQTNKPRPKRRERLLPQHPGHGELWPETPFRRRRSQHKFELSAPHNATDVRNGLLATEQSSLPGRI